MDWRSLLNGETVDGQDIVLWYEGTGHELQDEFFLHGGFFGSAVQVTRVNHFPGRITRTAYESVNITNITPRKLRAFLTLDNLSAGAVLSSAALFIPSNGSYVFLPLDRRNPRAPVIDLTPSRAAELGPQSTKLLRLTFHIPGGLSDPMTYHYLPRVSVELSVPAPR